MGWTFTDAIHVGDDIKGYLDNKMSGENVRILDSAMVGNEYYAAAEINSRENGKKFVTAFVVLTSRSKGEFGWKSMDETMGPNASNCPEKILKKLSPVSELSYHGYAQEWRERCLATHQKKKEKSKFLSLMNPGDVLAFDPPIKFNVRGTEVQVKNLEIQSINRGAFIMDAGAFLCKISRQYINERYNNGGVKHLPAEKQDDIQVNNSDASFAMT